MDGGVMVTASLLRVLPRAWARLLVRGARYLDLQRAIQLAHVETALPTPLHGQQILGAGNSIAPALLSLAARGARATGVDVEPRAVSGAERLARALRLEDARFQVAAPASLPFRDRRFDVVIAADFLERSSDLTRTLKELTRVLRPGGILALTVMAGGRGNTLVGRLPGGWLRPEGAAGRFSRDDLRQRLEMLGFEIVDSGPMLTGIGGVVVDAFARVRVLDRRRLRGRLLYAVLSPLLYLPALVSDAIGQERKGYGLRIFAVRRSDSGGPPRGNGNGHGLALEYTTPLARPEGTPAGRGLPVRSMPG